MTKRKELKYIQYARAKTVGELKEILNQFPDDMPIYYQKHNEYITHSIAEPPIEVCYYDKIFGWDRDRPGKYLTLYAQHSGVDDLQEIEDRDSSEFWRALEKKYLGKSRNY